MKNYQRNEFFAGVFDRAAKSYSMVGPDYFKYYGARLAEVLNIAPGTAVLDLACGRGASLFPASEKVGQNGKVIGVDFSENMVAETSKAMREKGFKNVEIRQMDAQDLLFDGNVFDYVSCGFAIQFFPNYALVLREMLRVLKPGGKLCFTVWKKREKPPIPLRMLSKYIDRETYEKMTAPKMEFGVAETLEKIFTEAGFKNVLVTAEDKRFYFKDSEQWIGDQMSHAGRSYFEVIENLCPYSMESFKADVLKTLDEVRDEKGIYFDANMFYVTAEKVKSIALGHSPTGST